MGVAVGLQVGVAVGPTGCRPTGGYGCIETYTWLWL